MAREEVEVVIGARLLGICLIVLAAACSAGTAVYNRSLKTIDYMVVMSFHGLFGFVISLGMLSIKCFVLLDESSGFQETRMLDMAARDCTILAFGASIDAFSILGQIVAF